MSGIAETIEAQLMQQSAMTFRTLVRRIGYQYGIKGLLDEEVDYILWEQTAFPFNTRDLYRLRNQIHGVFRAAQAKAVTFKKEI